jgi:predicted RecA/RadA family phage recombinase
MRNYVQDGKTLSLIAPYAVDAGEGALVGSCFGVAVSDVANGVEGEFMTEGVFELEKTSAQAWTQGVKVYWDNTAKVCTTTSTSNTLIGVATEAAANPSSTGKVKLGIVA